MDPSLRVIDYVKEGGELVQTADGTISASAMLERFFQKINNTPRLQNYPVENVEDCICSAF